MLPAAGMGTAPTPTISTVRVPLYEMGAAAAGALASNTAARAGR
jgi:DNA-binding LacI/PurR family transcriptional regulator